MSRLYPRIINAAILPIYDAIRGTKRKKYANILNQTQWHRRKDIEELQEKNLHALIKHAYETVPYYHKKFKESKVTPDDIRKVDDLIKIPILTKRDITKYRSELISTAVGRRNWFSSVSGGTGDQISFYITKEQMSWELAAEFRGYEWAGYKLGDRCINFWGSPIDTAKHGSYLKKATSSIERVKLVNTYIISEEEMNRHTSLLRSFKPEVVKGYSSSVYMVAKHLKEQDINDIRPRSIITSAEMLTSQYRSVIEEAFGCKVFDYYGSREIGALASECGEHDGFHINAENVVMEFIRENEPVVDESGMIYITNLRNYGMPFIRYEIGDIGTPTGESCNCGRGLPLMESLEGRASQFMAVYDKELGKIIPVSTAAPGIISNILMHVPVESYRILQESLDKIIIMLVAGEGYNQKDTDYIIKHMYDYLGDRISVEIRQVDNIPPLPSGKRFVFISKINAFKKE